jgi:uncharacterized NAD-dependent epimerase/dehydratase family protein
MVPPRLSPQVLVARRINQPFLFGGAADLSSRERSKAMIARRTAMNAMTQRLGEFLVDAYVADPDAGVLHRLRAGCAVPGGVFYLNWRTAVVHGYDLCHCCAVNVAQQPAMPATGGH